jgi:hypothetical protein
MSIPYCHAPTLVGKFVTVRAYGFRTDLFGNELGGFPTVFVGTRTGFPI